MPNRCSATKVVEVEGEDLTLQCIEWSADPEGRHEGDHHVQLSPALGGSHTWTNRDPLPPPEKI